MVVQHNISAMNANRLFGINNSGLSKSLEKLSSGYAINRAGDNAAGLAVSEKMRAQISGLTQASKNAEDGISMVQTFEGALTETDSILQRMRTLAVQSANGTYQDDVDREAIQLEYDQLNDELNQIADTDFNGVVVLNGGQMADGLKAVDGEFNYANKAGQMADANSKALADAQKTAQAAIDKAQNAYDKAVTKFNATGYDITENGLTAEYNTIDNNALTQAQMDTLWGTQVGANAGDTLKAAGATEVTVTYKATVDAAGAITWAVDSASCNATDKSKVVDATLKTAMATAVEGTAVAGTATQTGLGGFKLPAAMGTANVIFDASQVKTGDTVTLVFTNEGSANNAPTNVGFDTDSVESNVASATGSFAAPSIAKGTITDADMNANLKAVFDALNESTITATKTGTAGTTYDSIKINDEALTIGGDGSVITLRDADGNALVDENGDALKVHIAATAAGQITISTVNADGISAGDKTLATVTMGEPNANATTGTQTVGLAFESYSFGSDANFGIRAGDNTEQGTSAAARAELDAAKKVLDDAKAAYPETFEDLDLGNVSKSDSNDASTATLTYQDNITLQTGARTKDSVNFTFSYKSDGLGELNADLDCSARGLGTDKLSLADQKSANTAIDKIDNAINKVSMVRASFGAMQNRLEHKIANLDVNTENLTAAESRIRDTDMASEMTNFTKNQILSQASQAMLAQANQLPQGVLQLLG